ncbi:Membrane metallo-endopeptidase-like 1 [Portunus trituberculatus]|uniref:Membrane metallo-endopeptidase-like 1 n=1 Tax=Portunus trituberculatus TaxID=210409 RepID=A0A5B7EZW6_PORTR|nr:Membrane metallo-endopeptidase-like 1 [Portunus trituberculatus]
MIVSEYCIFCSCEAARTTVGTAAPAAILKATMPEADRHDTGENYMKMSLAKLEQEVPEFKWADYLSAFLDEDLSDDEPIVVYSMPYLKRLAKIMVSSDTRWAAVKKTTTTFTSILEKGEVTETHLTEYTSKLFLPRVLWNYVLWRLTLDMTQHLNRDYRARRHEFQKVLLGIQSDRNRWNLCIDWTNKRLGMAVGALFIKENFNPESKTRLKENTKQSVACYSTFDLNGTS